MFYFFGRGLTGGAILEGAFGRYSRGLGIWKKKGFLLLVVRALEFFCRRVTVYSRYSYIVHYCERVRRHLTSQISAFLLWWPSFAGLWPYLDTFMYNLPTSS